MDMVVVASVGTRFEAELLAAKLGAHGVLWEIRSRELVPTTHPIGFLDVLVPADERDVAEEILAPDELALPADASDTGPAAPRLTPAVRTLRLALGLGLLVAVAAFVGFWIADALRFLDVVR